MAKIRVYELAKKLNMTNRALLLKLEAMNIEVKSHMSSLEDETVAQIKEALFGKKDRNSDKRVRPSVIRRRKKSKKKRSTEDENLPTDDNAESDDVLPGDLEEGVDVGDDVSETADVDGVGQTDGDMNFSSEEPLDPLPSQTDGDDEEPVAAPEKEAPPARGKNSFKKRKAESAKIVRPAPTVSSDSLSTAVSDPSSVDEDASSVDASDKEKDGRADDVVEIGTGHDVGEKEGADEDVSARQKATSSMTEISDHKAEPEETTKEADMPTDLETLEPVQGSNTSDAVSKEKDNEKAALSDHRDAEGDNEMERSQASARESSEGGDGDDKKRRKKQKKQKKSEPAKIIKLAVPVPKPKRGNEEERRNDGAAPAGNHRSGAPSHGGPSAAHPENGFPNDGPADKDDLKSKRRKGKGKKKRRGDEAAGDTGDEMKARKRKSVVEGKDLYESGFSGKKGRKKEGRGKRSKAQKTQITVPKAIKRRIKIDETIDLSELAKRMSIKANEMIVKLMGMGVMATVNQTIDFDTAALVAAEFDYEVERAAAVEDVLIQAHEEEKPENLIERSPVVTIMGHVDHGKTSLLDVIRKSKITTGEAGGITQHIGAYNVETPNGGVVTFLDTPGHEAFTSMRSRGAQVTDIVVLVVAADDGVMPQTVEAINHSKAAGVPVVVAVNKMDKPDADPDRVTRELAEYGLLSEDWGGDVIFVRVSAKTQLGIDQLLEMILLQAEVLELKANPNRPAIGHVVEARLDAGRGPVATVLVQQGTLKAGEPVVCGLHSGKIRVMINDMGENVESAGPSMPVEIVGLSGVPDAGDEFVALASEKDAKQISESRMQKERAKELAKKSRANLEKLFANMGAGEVKELKLLIKADVHGSLEALNDSLMKLVQEEVDIKIVHSGIGAINESDVSLAAVSDAIIIGFNVRPTPKVREMAKEENVDMRFYDIIYNVINDIKAALTGLMPSTFHEKILGRAEVRDTFVIPSRGTIAGCFVLDGKVTRGEKVRLLREGVVKCDSVISSLRRFKDDAKEVAQGYECGIGIEKYNDIKLGDIIECYEIEERKASLDSLKE